jgi:hypothetical protein
MRPSPTYRTAAKDRTIPPVSRNDVPALREHVEDGLATGIRKGKVRNKVGMWGNLSPYYANSVTIDSRWGQTVSNRHA